VALFVLGTIGFALLGLPKVSSFSPQLSSQRPQTSRRDGRPSNSKSFVHSWFLNVAATETETEASADTASASTRSLMEDQAGGNASNRRRRKERIRNSDDGESNGAAAYESSRTPEEIPDPLVSFDSVESVRLMDSDSVELVLRSDKDDKQQAPRIVDPRDLHQTSDFDLWMALRKHVVDVSASQLSVVLGTNYFTSREKLLQDKIQARISGSGSGSDSDSDGDLIFLGGGDTDEETKSPSRSNSKACAWGIKMEPLAFNQYSDLLEATNDDDDEGSPQNHVEETGMYLLKHVDPNTQKTYVFGASPDGIVTEHRIAADGDDASTPAQPSVGLLEIKSLWGRRHKTSLPDFDRCPSRFYDQIQGQMAICDKEWCDLMLFIPAGDATGSGGNSKNKRKGKSAKKRKKQAAAAAAKTTRKKKGRNYSIVRVKRNEEYWNETVLPALIQFCDEVEAGTAKAKEAKDENKEGEEPKAPEA
jgi:hypothetical protein